MNTTIYINMKSLKNAKKMFNTRLNAHGGFTPAAVASPNAIPPEQVKYDNPRTGNTSLSRSAQGRCGGTGTVPSANHEKELLFCVQDSH